VISTLGKLVEEAVELVATSVSSSRMACE